MPNVALNVADVLVGTAVAVVASEVAAVVPSEVAAGGFSSEAVVVVVV